MAASTFTQIREALANQLGSQITGLRTVTTRLGQVNPPCVVVLPEPAGFADYQVSMDGQADWHLRVVVVASAADSTTGQDILDPFLETTGPQSIWAAVRADPTLGGMVGFACVIGGTGYGIMNFGTIDYLAATFSVAIGD